MTLCKFCREIPNETVTTITIAGGKDLPACVPCYKEYQEQAYNDWLADQPEDDRDMRDSSIDVVRELWI